MCEVETGDADCADAAAPDTIVIAGMHRSGTSLTAALLAGGGIDMGARLLGAARGNDLGHFEDLDFKELQARALEGWGIDDSGFTRQPGIRLPAGLRRWAERLVATRLRAARPWGWKDPRTVLFLEDWTDLLPAAVHVVVFRRPWEVVDSLFRRGDDVFQFNPPFAISVWVHYNRLLLNFVRRHPRRCVVFEVCQIATDPLVVSAALRNRLGVRVGDPPTVFEPRRLHVDDAAERADLVRAYAPEAFEIYRSLQELAGSTVALPALAPFRGRPPGLEEEIVAWAAAARASTGAPQVWREAA